MAYPRTSWAIALIAMCALLLLVVAVGLSDDASANTIRVPTDKQTIMKAMEAASSGDTVLVSSGYYEENILISKRITLKGTMPNTAVLSNPGYPSVVRITSPGVTLVNFKIEGTSEQVGVHVDDVGDITLDNLLIVNCDKGILAVHGSDLVVRDCTIKNSASTGLKVEGVGVLYERVSVSDTVLEGNEDSGIWLAYCRLVQMDRLTVKSNSGIGVRATSVSYAYLRNSTLNANLHGLVLYQSNAWTVEDSVFQNNMENGIEINESGEISGNVLRRNLITDNSKAEQSSAAGVLFTGRASSGNMLEGNIVRSNPIGLNFVSPQGGCSQNSFRENRVTRCGYAVWENSGTGPNEYVLNNFEDNSIIVAAVSYYTTFDDGELGNYWGDYVSKYPFAHKDGPVWNTPYMVKLGVAVYDHFPLAYRYEQDPPVIDRLFLMEGEVLAPGYPATFGAGAHDASAITQYRWTVLPPKGAESSYTTATYVFTFTFDQLGPHWLTVQVTDVWGFSASLARQFNVEDTIPPVAEAGPDLTVNLRSTLTLDGSASSDNHGIASVSWVFDPDGLNLVFRSSVATLTMNKLGVFQAVLFVVDFSGNSASDKVTVYVKDLTPPYAVAGVDATISLGSVHSFDGTSSTDNVGVVLWRWTINRNGGLLSTILEPTFDYTFSYLGKYEVTLIAKDAAGNEDQDSIQINVVDNGPPMADAGQDREVLMGATVSLDGAASTDNVEITKYEWSFSYLSKIMYLFGDRVTYRFDVPGKYLVTLAVFDAAGNHDTDVVMVDVVDTDPPVARYWVSEDIKLGGEAILDASGSEDNVAIKVVEWRVVHGGTTTVLRGIVVRLPIVQPGTYRITLAVRDYAGNEDTKELSFYVAPKGTEAEGPTWLVPTMAATLAVAVLLGYLYARKRYSEE